EGDRRLIRRSTRDRTLRRELQRRVLLVRSRAGRFAASLCPPARCLLDGVSTVSVEGDRNGRAPLRLLHDEADRTARQCATARLFSVETPPRIPLAGWHASRGAAVEHDFLRPRLRRVVLVLRLRRPGGGPSAAPLSVPVLDERHHRPALQRDFVLCSAGLC